MRYSAWVFALPCSPIVNSLFQITAKLRPPEMLMYRNGFMYMIEITRPLEPVFNPQMIELWWRDPF